MLPKSSPASRLLGFRQLKLKSPPAHTRGFTLTELLTVIAIIGVLAAIVIPVVSKLRTSARQSECVSRLRHLGTAFQLFANENKGRLPSEGPRPRKNGATGPNSEWRWYFQLLPYVDPVRAQAYWEETISANDIRASAGRLFKCPTTEHTTGTLGIFLYNQYLDFPNRGYAPVRLAGLSTPARLPILGTANEAVGHQDMFNDGTNVFGPHASAMEHGYSGPTNLAGPSPNFGNKGVFLMADGHVKAANICDRNAWPWNDSQVFLPR